MRTSHFFHLPIVADLQMVAQDAVARDVKVALPAAVQPRLLARLQVELGAAPDPPAVAAVAEHVVAEEGEGL